MQIKGIRLVNGDELIARTHEANSQGDLDISSPLLVVIGQSQQGNLIVNFMPWSLIAEKDMTLRSHAYMSVYDVPKEVEDNYIQNTSGLKIVSGAEPSQILKG